jgi:hypothetical protein
MTSIIPVSAKKGGKTATTITLSGDIDYEGPAERLRDTKRYFSLSIGVEGKNQPRLSINYTGIWPGYFKNKELDSYKTFITIHINKDEGEQVRMTCSHEDADGNWVMWCKGTWGYDDGLMQIWIYEVRTSEGLTEFDEDEQPYFTIEIQSS